MSYRNLVKKQVRAAFKLLGDLVVEVTLNQSDATEYNFSDAEVVQSTTATTVVKGVILSTVRKGAIIKAKLLLDSEDISDLTDYDSVSIDTVTWRIESYDDNGYAAEVSLVREA